MKDIKKIAIITYNRIGDGQFDNGIIKKQHAWLHIAQNGHRSKWAADPDYGSGDGRNQTRSRTAAAVVAQFDLSVMNHTYVYVGASGGEEAIRQTRNLDPNKVTYVLCNCNYGTKKSMIRQHGNHGAAIMECECGGRKTLERVAQDLLREQ